MRKDLIARLSIAVSLRTQWAAVLAGLAGLVASSAVPAQVLIDPVVVELGAQQRAATLTVSLSDKARAPMRLQSQVLRWKQDVHGEDITEPSTDLLVTPPIAEIQPGQKQLFRVALRGARPGQGELAYRLVLEDVAPAQAEAKTADAVKIQFRMRYDMPVLVAPTGAVLERLRWKPCQAPAGQACLLLRNDGNRYVKLQSLAVSGDGWQQTVTLKKGASVLAGNEREWQIILAPGHGGPLRGLQLQTAGGKNLQAELVND